MRSLPYKLCAFFIIAFSISAVAQEPTPIGILLAAGDITGCKTGRRNDHNTAALLKIEIDAAKSRNIPVKILALGDLAYDHGSAESFKCFAEQWRREEFYAHLLPVMGNHDNETNNGKPFYDFFQKNEFVTQNGKTAGYCGLNFPDPAVGPWRLLGLNGYPTSKQQLDWIKSDLGKSAAPCVLAFAHPYILSSGYHGHNDADEDALKKSAKNANKKFVPPPVRQSGIGRALFSALYPFGVTLYLGAHDHHFEQFGRHDVDGNLTPDGIRSFLVGTGGHKLYARRYTTKANAQEFYQHDHHGILKIRLFESSYDWTFLPAKDDAKPDLTPTPPTLEPSKDTCAVRRVPK